MWYGSHMSLSIYSPADLKPDIGAIKQMDTCLAAAPNVGGVLCADHHLGYSMPIGGAIAYTEHISPSGVGYDIGCGNKAVATSLSYSDVKDDMPRIMDEIVRRISFGMGQSNDEQVKDHPVFDHIQQDSPIQAMRGLLGTARKQLGTVGAGNHYVDLFAEEGTDRLWIGVHFGSRGFGHKVASGFLALAQGKEFSDHADGGEMHSPPVLFHIDSGLGHAYIEAMTIAGEYAYAGRDVVCDKVLEILGSPDVFKEVHNHHNFAWLEHGAWVVRKGSTPLYPGQQGFVGASMGEDAVIIEGVDHPSGPASLWSAPHGAGRMMSRTEAKGKSRKRWFCQECGWTQQKCQSLTENNLCPSCGHWVEKKVWVQEKEGLIDWKGTLNYMKRAGIELRGGAADEAPLAYKRLPEVLDAHRDYVEVKHVLRPVGVAMAGPNTRDDYKD